MRMGALGPPSKRRKRPSGLLCIFMKWCFHESSKRYSRNYFCALRTWHTTVLDTWKLMPLHKDRAFVDSHNKSHVKLNRSEGDTPLSGTVPCPETCF